MSKIQLLMQAKKEKWKICVYGLGTYGKTCSKEFLSYLGIEADYYCDRSIDRVKEFQAEENKKIDIKELKSMQEDVLVFLFLSSKYEDIVCRELEMNKKLHMLTWENIHSVLNQDEILKKYFAIEKFADRQKEREYEIREKQNESANTNGKIAVYTCITNNYDKLNKPLVIEDNCDYFFITDLPQEIRMENEEYYKRISIKSIVPKYISSPKDQNRYCKMHGYSIFSKYEYSIYIDGSVQIQRPISELVGRIGTRGIALHKHPFAQDAYLEAFSLSARLRLEKEEAKKTMQSFAKEGFPRNYGMAECGIIVCRNDNYCAQAILNSWYRNYEINLIKRDQIYFAYTLWKMGIEIDEVCKLSGNLRTNGFFTVVSSHSGR